ncbi:hypothetical protein GOBAR_AA15804 [Gossypium barbadense]|uniref:Uncharacterized protein n=1 Tax=Gossypium barbadense TaxID=3634 RepID=A0A2P5XNH7_GOSBA|nr:hypothetical protein GOBAR_AA15804 [Gossypium barbadense]
MDRHCLAGGLVYTDNLLPAAPVGLLGLLLLFQLKAADSLFFFQTTRVRFVFDDEALYSTFVNWELWWPSFPILVYFKETQTKPEGQVHFFPVIFEVKVGEQLEDSGENVFVGGKNRWK